MALEVVIDTMKLEGVWFGPESSDAPVIVMLHEGLGSVSTWRGFPQQVASATGTRVFAYSRFGHGLSSVTGIPRPPDALHREALDVLPKLLNEIGFRKGLLLGHSDGGSIVTIYAGHIRDQGVEGIILVEPHFNVEEKNISSIRQMVDTFNTTDLRARLARHHANVDAMFTAWSGMWLDPQFEKFDITPDLAAVEVPMLFIKGEDDPYSTMLQAELAKTKSAGPVETAVIPGSGHFPHRNDPKATLEAIARFSDKVLGARR